MSQITPATLCNTATYCIPLYGYYMVISAHARAMWTHIRVHTHTRKHTHLYTPSGERERGPGYQAIHFPFLALTTLKHQSHTPNPRPSVGAGEKYKSIAADFFTTHKTITHPPSYLMEPFLLKNASKIPSLPKISPP